MVRGPETETKAAPETKGAPETNVAPEMNAAPESAAADYPVVRTYASGVLTISRVCVGSAAAADSSDGFHASFTARTGELYETTLKDEDVGEICSGDMILGSVAFARLLHNGTERITVARDQVVVAWNFQIMLTLNCAVHLVLDRIAPGTPAALEARLRAQASRIAELETRITELTNIVMTTLGDKRATPTS